MTVTVSLSIGTSSFGPLRVSHAADRVMQTNSGTYVSGCHI
jgi:hypothetical protein